MELKYILRVRFLSKGVQYVSERSFRFRVRIRNRVQSYFKVLPGLGLELVFGSGFYSRRNPRGDIGVRDKF